MKERDRSSEARLADAYRGLAEERAPDYLNDRVLRLAAGTRTRYSRARAWMRPAAWAAVIGLSLAIVLDMTRLPRSEPDSIGISIPGGRSAGDRREARDRIDDNRATEAEAIVSPSVAPTRQGMDTGSINSADGGADRGSNDDFLPRDMTILRNAEEMARTRAGSDQGLIPTDTELDETDVGGDLREEAQNGMAAGRAVVIESVEPGGGDAEGSGAAAPLATTPATGAPVSARYCAESEREEPGSWIACIRRLEEDGREAEARDEYEEFRRVFPDFDAQDADK